MSEHKLEISKYGRPVIWIAAYYYQTLPGTAVPYITNQCVFSTRREAVRWARFELRGEIDWHTWQSSTKGYPYLTNYDAEMEENRHLSPTFIATLTQTFGPDAPLPGTLIKRVSVHRTEVCGVFDWWAPEANGDWNRSAEL